MVQDVLPFTDQSSALLLQPIPVCGNPFSHILIDCVGPLPKTKTGNCYLLTIMCQFTRFPKVIPLRNIKALKIVHSLVKIFTFVRLPVSSQSDLGSNFMSSLIQVMHELGVYQYKSSPYHPSRVPRSNRMFSSDAEEYDQGILF